MYRAPRYDLFGHQLGRLLFLATCILLTNRFSNFAIGSDEGDCDDFGKKTDAYVTVCRLCENRTRGIKPRSFSIFLLFG